MYPDREMLRRWSFCHRQPSCWSRTLEPMVNVVTTEFELTSQIFEVLSPEAESKWAPSGLQLTCSDKTARVSENPAGQGPRKPLAPAPEREEARSEVVGHARAETGRAPRPRHPPDVTPKLCATTPTPKLPTANLSRWPRTQARRSHTLTA